MKKKKLWKKIEPLINRKYISICFSSSQVSLSFLHAMKKKTSTEKTHIWCFLINNKQKRRVNNIDVHHETFRVCCLRWENSFGTFGAMPAKHQSTEWVVAEENNVLHTIIIIRERKYFSYFTMLEVFLCVFCSILHVLNKFCIYSLLEVMLWNIFGKCLEEIWRNECGNSKVWLG